MNKKVSTLLLVILVLIINFSCKNNDEVKNESLNNKSLALKFKDNFYIGAAINKNQILGVDTIGLNIIKKEFNSITPENDMKWEQIHPKMDTFYFDIADKYVDFGVKNKMNVIGHTLVWHSQLAPWMNEVKDSISMQKHIKNHINTIVSRYKGKINSWDVVNEALNEDGTFRESNFYNILGENYIELAFAEAAKADPNADLVYNDYNLWKPEKRAGVVKLVKQLQQKGIKIDGVGMQGHYNLTEPTLEDIENSIVAFGELGVKVMFTELDITILPNPWDLEGAEVSQNYEKYEGDIKMDPYRTELPQEVEQKLAKRYEDIFNLFLKHKDKISRVTFWGVNDGQSWLNDWPIKGRTNYPLLFDRNFSTKKAYESVIALKQTNHN